MASTGWTAEATEVTVVTPMTTASAFLLLLEQQIRYSDNKQQPQEQY